MDMTRVNWAMWGRGREKEKGGRSPRCSSQEAKVTKGLKCLDYKRKEVRGLRQSSTWAGDFKVEGGETSHCPYLVYI